MASSLTFFKYQISNNYVEYCEKFPGFMVYLAGLSMLGFLAIDMYLPAFGAMQDTLHTSEGAISASLSIFLAGFAFAQLLWGPLSDKLGRKPVLIVGLTIFIISSLAIYWWKPQHSY